MKYDDYKTLAEKRRKEIYQMHLDKPDMTHAEIGVHFDNLSKQRIRQVIQSEKTRIAEAS